MKKCGIYCIENLVNGKRYIGLSNNIDSRFSQHRSDIKNKRKQENIHLLRSVEKYGIENFKFLVLETCNSEELVKREQYYIKKHDTTNREKGYNISSGGRLTPDWTGKHHSEVTKKKQSLSAMGNTRWLGKKHLPESKYKISVSLIGKKKYNSLSKYFGIAYKTKTNRWEVYVRIKGKKLYVGSSKDEIIAAKIYDYNIRKLKLNRPVNFPEISI